MPIEASYLLHYGAGALAILFWWGAILNRKGSRRHKAFGRWFLAGMAGTLATVGLIFFASSRDFAPPEVVQYVYLVLCVVAVAGTAFAAIRLKSDLERFRGAWFRLLGIAAFAMGALVLAVGVATGQVVPVLFSVIGLLYGGAMIRFAWFRGQVQPNWWQSWHLNGMCFMFDAVHGTFLAVTWRLIFDPQAGDGVTVVAHLFTMSVALALRLHYGRRFNAPLRFAASPALAVAA